MVAFSPRLERLIACRCHFHFETEQLLDQCLSQRERARYFEAFGLQQLLLGQLPV
jgi:hypothetical protein